MPAGALHSSRHLPVLESQFLVTRMTLLRPMLCIMLYIHKKDVTKQLLLGLQRQHRCSEENAA